MPRSAKGRRTRRHYTTKANTGYVLMGVIGDAINCRVGSVTASAVGWWWRWSTVKAATSAQQTVYITKWFTGGLNHLHDGLNNYISVGNR